MTSQNVAKIYSGITIDQNPMKSFTCVILFFLLARCQQQNDDKLTIATAANMQFASKELISVFEQDYNIDCEMVVSSSGKLTAQITEGAPYDVFLSADMRYPTVLFEKGLTVRAPQIYAFGKLVIWTNTKGLTPKLESLTLEQIRHIAIANPKTAPYGKAAAEVLQKLKLMEKIEDKLVYGESISQTNQFILSGVAEIGFTAKAVMLSPNINGVGLWEEVAEGRYTPIAQGVTLLKYRPKQQEAAKKFYEFLFSAKGKEILNKFGYSTPE